MFSFEIWKSKNFGLKEKNFDEIGTLEKIVNLSKYFISERNLKKSYHFDEMKISKKFKKIENYKKKKLIFLNILFFRKYKNNFFLKGWKFWWNGKKSYIFKKKD